MNDDGDDEKDDNNNDDDDDDDYCIPGHGLGDISRVPSAAVVIDCMNGCMNCPLVAQ